MEQKLFHYRGHERGGDYPLRDIGAGAAGFHEQIFMEDSLAVLPKGGYLAVLHTEER